MEDKYNLVYINKFVSKIDKSFNVFQDSYNLNFPETWDKCAKEIQKTLSNDFPVYCKIRKEKSNAGWEMTIDGYASVLTDFDEPDIDLYIYLSPELFSKDLPIPDETWLTYKSMFRLTVIHELAHTFQYDDGKNKDDMYFDSPLEIDAYSTELAFDMYLNKRQQLNCDSYQRYVNLDDDLFKAFLELSNEKYDYLNTINS